MDRLKRKKILTASAASAAVLVLYLAITALFAPLVDSRAQRLSETRESLARARANLADQDALAREWEANRSLLESQGGTEALLNQWVKDLLDYAASQGMVFTKLEPQGERKGSGRDEARLYLAFQGDAGKLAALLYFLREKDPVSRIETFVMKQDDGQGRFSFELTLGKALR